MDAAGAELTAFRQELGQSLATLLRRLEKRQDALCASWREDLTALTLAAVEAGTGWLLHSEHEAVLRRLVLEAVNLLEDRTSISVRVHPDDEASVGGLFQAARERAPELRQWVVTGDPNLEPGDLVAESGSGSVDCRRAYFSDMVAGVLTHLTLPQRPEEAAEAAALGDLVAQEAARLAAPEAVPDAPAGAESPAAATLHAVAPEAAPAASEGPASELSAPDAPLSQPAAPDGFFGTGYSPCRAGTDFSDRCAPADSSLSAPAASGTMPAELPATDPSAPAPHTATVAASAVPSESPSVAAAAESQSVPPLDEPLAPETVGAAPSAPAAAPSVDGAGAAGFRRSGRRCAVGPGRKPSRLPVWPRRPVQVCCLPPQQRRSNRDRPQRIRPQRLRPNPASPNWKKNFFRWKKTMRPATCSLRAAFCPVRTMNAEGAA